jgi:hypothetical protein
MSRNQQDQADVDLWLAAGIALATGDTVSCARPYEIKRYNLRDILLLALLSSHLVTVGCVSEGVTIKTLDFLVGHTYGDVLALRHGIMIP